MRTTRRTRSGESEILVEGVWLSTEAVRKAYQELQKPKQPEPIQFLAGQVVTHKEYRRRRFFVCGAWLNNALDKTHGLRVPASKIRITDGKTTYTVLRTDVTVVEGTI